ncbi:hypothetical protein CORC01_07108 [Colletotrichum orchidophilum]|uniref:Uncharacterized protein n=1 Tax=Colletotrichum orchidophilum TaxID=1209926 RepID=A0A1G4B8N4_9PEZI|nr:uncharacterized protein CORC01_07108 [Colletotrichum orchidophilum]OHE97693.1 hypothetical protein CORC01_07108 [Colletotrichum orchidophilum]
MPGLRLLNPSNWAGLPYLATCQVRLGIHLFLPSTFAPSTWAVCWSPSIQCPVHRPPKDPRPRPFPIPPPTLTLVPPRIIDLRHVVPSSTPSGSGATACLLSRPAGDDALTPPRTDPNLNSRRRLTCTTERRVAELGFASHLNPSNPPAARHAGKCAAAPLTSRCCKD